MLTKDPVLYNLSKTPRWLFYKKAVGGELEPWCTVSEVLSLSHLALLRGHREELNLGNSMDQLSESYDSISVGERNPQTHARTRIKLGRSLLADAGLAHTHTPNSRSSHWCHAWMHASHTCVEKKQAHTRAAHAKHAAEA